MTITKHRAMPLDFLLDAQNASVNLRIYISHRLATV